MDPGRVEPVPLLARLSRVPEGEDGEGAEGVRHVQDLLHRPPPILQRGDAQPYAAQALGVPPGTVKSRLNKARSKLKEVLGDGTDF